MQLLAGLFIPFLSEEAKEARDEQRFTPACNRNHVCGEHGIALSSMHN